MKKLLKESEIRKMMKFANIGSLTNTFVDRLNETGMYEDDELTLNEEDDEEELDDDETDVPPPVPDDLPGEEPPPPAEEEEDLDFGDPGGDEPTVTAEEGLEGLSAFLQAVTDPTVGPELAGKVDVQLSDEEPGLEEPGLEEPGLEEPGLEEPGLEGPMPGDEAEAGMAPSPETAFEEPGPEDELEEAQIEMQDDDDFVNEIVRKVAKRLLRKR